MLPLSLQIKIHTLSNYAYNQIVTNNCTFDYKRKLITEYSDIDGDMYRFLNNEMQRKYQIKLTFAVLWDILRSIKFQNPVNWMDICTTRTKQILIHSGPADSRP